MVDENKKIKMRRTKRCDVKSIKRERERDEENQILVKNLSNAKVTRNHSKVNSN